MFSFIPNVEDRKCYATEYAKSMGAFISDSLNTTRWWLSTLNSGYKHYAIIVDTDGTFGSIGGPVDYAYYTVRPAIWVSLDVISK